MQKSITERIPQTNMLIAEKYILGEKFANGSFGDIYYGNFEFFRQKIFYSL